MRASKRRVLHLTRERRPQAPHRPGRPRGPQAHDGTIRTERVDERWATGPTATLAAERQAAVCIRVDQGSGAYLAIHAARRATRVATLEPLRQALRHGFGAFAEDSAAGIRLRHDHSSPYVAAGFQAEVAFPGRESSPAPPRPPGRSPLGSDRAASWRAIGSRAPRAIAAPSASSAP